MSTPRSATEMAAGQRPWGRVSTRRTVFCVVSALCCFTLLLVINHVSRLHKIAESSAATARVSVEKHHGNNNKTKGFTSQSLRVVHLDLKGAPPKMTYLRELLPVLAAAGCNALLVEYEDMFPYHGNIVNISAKNAYTRQQVLDLLSWSHALGMQVIPLVQTFGHMEYALKLAEFRHLRELDSFPQELCPSEPASLTLVKEMIRQIMSLHRTARHLHIGCDEVFHLAACRKCTRTHKTGRELYVEHVTRVAEYVRAKYPGVTPLVWDDMIRQWNPQYLQSTTLGGLVEPVVWVYTDNISQLVPNYIWYWYTKTFPTVWIAGAFKGASLPTSVLPDVQHHFNNQRSWLQFITSTTNGDDIKISGFVLTGWSRFDHFATLCELLPPSIPSLLINLLLVSNPDTDYGTLQQKWKHSLKCPPKSDLSIENLAKNPQAVSLCSFPGTSSFMLMSEYLMLKSQVDWLISYLTERKAWMTPYNVKHNFSNPWRIIEDFTQTSGRKLFNDLLAFKNNTHKILSQYYDKYTVIEWTEQRIAPLEDKMNDLNKIMETLVDIETWPRRPLT